MEKVITLNGQQRRIKANAKAVYIYNEQFNADFISDTFKALGGAEKIGGLIGMDRLAPDEMLALIDGFSAITIYQLFWALEKNADPETLPFSSWLDYVDFGVMDLIYEDDFLEVLIANFTRKN